MAKTLRQLKINEVSSVDNGAGEGVRVVLVKRDTGAVVDPKVEKKITKYLARNLFSEAEARAVAEKREFDQKERDRAASSGAAMSDGSFPIENEKDLRNAIRAIGRAKDPAKARAHIISRARSMGLTSLLPDDWKKAAKKRLRKQMKVALKAMGLSDDIIDKALDFDTAQANTESKEYAEGMMEEICEAVISLQQSVCSIMCEDDVTDKQAALEQTFQQFHDHLGGIVPEGIEQALQAAQLAASGATVNAQGAVQRKDNQMASTEGKPGEMAPKPGAMGEAKGGKKMKKLKKALKAAVSQVDALTKRAEVAEKNFAEGTGTTLAGIGKLSPEHREYVFHSDNTMSAEERAAFVAMTAEKRAEHVTANPLAKMTEKRLGELPEQVRKELEASREEREKFAKQREEIEVVEFGKRAVSLGLPVDFGKHMLAINKAAPEALAAVEKALKALGAQADHAKLFKEFGSTGGGTETDGVSKMNAAIAELRKADASLTQEQALAKIAVDPSKAEIWKAYRSEGVIPTSEKRAA